MTTRLELFKQANKFFFDELNMAIVNFEINKLHRLDNKNENG